MGNEIKIGIDMIDSAQKIGEIVNLLSDNIDLYNKGIKDYTGNYCGDANDNLNYLENGMISNLNILLNYYSVAAQCIILALKEYLDADQKLAQSIVETMEGMKN